MDFESLFDIPIDDLHTPCYLTDARLLQKNTALLKQIQQRTGCKIPRISGPSTGCPASGRASGGTPSSPSTIP